MLDAIQHVLGQESYGWHSLFGETGKSALAWSLCRLRDTQRATLIVELGEPYDYRQVASWSKIPEQNIVVLSSRQNVLADVVELCKTGDIGQVLFENLGFLLGSGKMLPEVENRLGDVTDFFELTSLAERLDIAYYATSFAVVDFLAKPGLGKERVLGGRLLEELAVEKKLKIKRTALLHRHGVNVGEKFRVQNMLTGAVCTYRVMYESGPIKIDPIRLII